MSKTPPHEHPLILNERRTLALALVLSLLTAILFVLMAVTPVRDSIQRLDNRFLNLMVTNRHGFVTAVAKAFNVIGLTVVTLPVRIVAAAFLAWRRRWWHFTAFVSSMVVSELCIGPLKSIYDRARPPGSLVTTGGASFPSGHAVAAAVTVVALVIALFPPRHRAVWGVAAAAFAILMGLSRAYLAAHWLSDAIVGVLLGTSVAVVTALVVQWIWDWQVRRGRSAPPLLDPIEAEARLATPVPSGQPQAEIDPA